MTKDKRSPREKELMRRLGEVNQLLDRRFELGVSNRCLHDEANEICRELKKIRGERGWK